MKNSTTHKMCEKTICIQNVHQAYFIFIAYPRSVAFSSLYISTLKQVGFIDKKKMPFKRKYFNYGQLSVVELFWYRLSVYRPIFDRIGIWPILYENLYQCRCKRKERKKNEELAILPFDISTSNWQPTFSLPVAFSCASFRAAWACSSSALAPAASSSWPAPALASSCSFKEPTSFWACSSSLLVETSSFWSSSTLDPVSALACCSSPSSLFTAASVADSLLLVYGVNASMKSWMIKSRGI